MKKGVLVLALAILLVSAAVYGKEKEKEDEGRHGEAAILGKADPDNSLLGFGWFDGKEGSCGYYYESRYSILKELKAVKAVPASDFTPEKMTYPVYAFEIGGTDHFSHTFFWTNGYLITKDGQAWRFDYNFEKLKAKAFDSKAEPRLVKSISDLPNGFYLTKPGGKWDPTRLTRSESVTEPEDVSLTVSSRLDPQINLRLENTGKELWSYGEAYWLEVQIGGDWYNVPPAMPDGLVVFDGVAAAWRATGVQQKRRHFTRALKTPDNPFQIHLVIVLRCCLFHFLLPFALRSCRLSPLVFRL